MSSDERRVIGLCIHCRFHSLVQSAKGEQYHLCEYAQQNAAYPKYPKLPVVACRAFQLLPFQQQQSTQ